MVGDGWDTMAKSNTVTEACTEIAFTTERREPSGIP